MHAKLEVPTMIGFQSGGGGYIIEGCPYITVRPVYWYWIRLSVVDIYCYYSILKERTADFGITLYEVLLPTLL